MDTFMNIGANKETVEAARIGINDILDSANADQTKICALDCFKSICSVDNVTVRDCVFTNNAPHNDLPHPVTDLEEEDED